MHLRYKTITYVVIFINKLLFSSILSCFHCQSYLYMFCITAGRRRPGVNVVSLAELVLSHVSLHVHVMTV